MTKDLCTYSIIILRHEKILRDHGTAAWWRWLPWHMGPERSGAALPPRLRREWARVVMGGVVRDGVARVAQGLRTNGGEGPWSSPAACRYPRKHPQITR